jgi:hypothetical protein
MKKILIQKHAKEKKKIATKQVRIKFDKKT